MASLVQWLGDKAKRVERQVNPFDGGATYSNPAPPQRPQVVQQPAQRVAMIGNNPLTAIQKTQTKTITPTPFNKVVSNLGNNVAKTGESVVKAVGNKVGEQVQGIENAPLGQLLQHGTSGFNKSLADYTNSLKVERKNGKLQYNPSLGNIAMSSEGGLKGAKASSSAEKLPTSTNPKTARSSSQTPKVSPRSVSPETTVKNAPQVQSGSGKVLPVQSVRQAAQRQLKAQIQTQENQALGSSLNNTPTRGFIKSVKASQEVSPTVSKAAQGTYKIRNTKQLQQSSENFVKQQGLSKAVEHVNSALDVSVGKVSDKTVSNAITVAKNLDANGSHAQATAIYEKLAPHLTKQGQSIQAASLLSVRTPEGLRYHIAKTFKKAGVNPSIDTVNAINAKLGEIKKTKVGTPERIQATKELQKIVADNLPSNVADKAVSFWKAGLLTGMRTQTGNILSNETFSVLHNASNPLAAGIDKLISLKTGQRTKTLTTKGLVSGTGEGIKRGGTFLKTGIDERAALTNKFDAQQVNFKNKVLNTYVNGVFKLMGAADRPHYYRQLQNSLYDLAKTEAKNQNIPLKQRPQFVKDFMSNPPADKFQIATNEAEKSVLANDTMLNNIVQKIRSAGDNAESPLGKAATNLVVNVIAPFTKVPSAFISRVVDFTPVGAIKTIATQISRKQFDQRALSTAISEAATGTAVMYLGSKLADNGLLSGNYPTSSKEQQRWKAEGIQPNSIKVGDKWLNMNYMGPVGLLFAAGARASGSKAHGDNWLAQQAQIYAGMPKDLTEQSFLQGLNNNLQAINDPGRYLNNAVKSQVGSLVPTLSNDVATATDKVQRQSNNAAEAVKSRIPGLRETLRPAQDVYGNTLDRKTGIVSTLVNPLRPTTDLTTNNPVKQEVHRLSVIDSQNNDLQVTPTVIPKVVTLDGVKTKLTDNQRYDLQKQIGQSTQAAWGQLIKTPEYQALSDIEKANALNRLRQDVTALAQRQFSANNGLGQWSTGYTGKQTNPTTAQIKLAQTGDVAYYARPKSTTITKSTSTKKTSTKKTSTKKSGGSKTSNKTQVAKLSSVIKAINQNKVAKTPKAPNFKVTAKQTKLKSTSLKKYAVKTSGKPTVKKLA